MKRKRGILQADNQSNSVITEGVAALRKAGFEEEECAAFAEKMLGLLDDGRDLFGVGKEFEYATGKRFGRLEFQIVIEGERFNPFEDGRGAKKRETDRSLRNFVNYRTTSVTYNYIAGKNIIAVFSPAIRRRELAIKSPIVWALFLGLLAGMICRRLPEEVIRFLIDDLANPVFSVVIGMMTGIMGPVIFVSLVLSISSLGSINKLTDLGGRIIRRFVAITFLVMAVSIAVSLFFYHAFGTEDTSFRFGKVISMLLDVFPRNLVTPFVENNTPQLVVMGFAMGIALLMLGDHANLLNSSLNQVGDWLKNTSYLIYRLTPLIPFISVFKLTANGQGRILLDGWEFIVAVYVSFTICVIIKLAKVSLRCGIGIPVLWKKAWPLFSRAFVTGSETATMMLEYDVSKNAMGINPGFSEFWIPISQAMLSVKTTVHLAIPPFLILKYTGMPITSSFLLVLIILTLEMSFASPGINSAWVILFASLALPSEYVGIFAVYKMLTTNYGSACSMLYSALEQIELSDAIGEMDKTYFKGEDSP